jgi:CspA family cold shock protein
MELRQKNKKIEKGNGGKMNKGIVKWFSCTKGYGFIAGVDGTDIFVHFSGILMNGFKTLREGQAVTYDIDETGGKTSAINVCPE